MTSLEIYIAGWLKMWYVLAIFAVLVAATFFTERRDKLEKKMAKANQRDNVKRTHHKKYSC